MKCTSPSPVAALNCRSIVWYDAAEDEGTRPRGGFNLELGHAGASFAARVQNFDFGAMLPGFYERHYARPQIGRSGRAVVAGETKL